MKNILAFLSVDEQKLSALILCLFVLVTVSGIECFRNGDIPGNLKDLTETLILAVAGINVMKGIRTNENHDSNSK